MRISVLALQGAFAEHRQMLRRLGVETFEVRRLSDWHQPKDALIIPGGESTVQLKLLRDLELLLPIRDAIMNGLYCWQSKLKTKVMSVFQPWILK